MNRHPERGRPATGLGRCPAATAVLVAATLIHGCVGVSAAEPGDGATPSEPGDGTPEAAVATTAVVRRDLTTTDEFAGQLGYGDAVPLVAGRDGVLTWVSEVGTVIGRGEVVIEIDGIASRLLFGDRPVWRRLAVGEADGPDIQQLNDNLAELGLADRDALPDERFDWRTREAVYRWQDELGLKRTGAVELGEVMFLPSEVRIQAVEAQLGTWMSPGQPVAMVTGTEKIVTVHLDVVRRGYVSETAPVVVVLPDRTRVDAIVRSIGRVASPASGGEGGEGDGEPTVKVEIGLGRAESTTSGAHASGLAADLDVAPVVVQVERVLAEDVLTVPVGALVALAGGGYGVERLTAGDSEVVGVEPGQFAEGLVEITGDVAEGDEVVVPS